MWDAAYVLGSLSSTERREYEAHLSGCKRCRAGVADLSGIPALLGLLDRDDVTDDGQTAGDPPPLPDGVLDALLNKVTRRRRRSRQLSWVLGAAAAIIVAIAVVVAAQPSITGQPGVAVTALTMRPVAPSELSATVTLTSRSWGTNIDMTCTYRESPDDRGDDPGDRLAMVAVGRDGSRTQLATWMAKSGVTARPAGSTSLAIAEIASVQVISADSGSVLLQQDL